MVMMETMCNKFETWALKEQSCPTLNDLESEELKKLTKRLKGDSEKETLANILEWQDRNIQFWWGRWLFGPLALVISLSFSFLLYYFKFPYVFEIFIVLTAFFFVLSSFNIILKAFYLFLFFLFIYQLINLALCIPVQAHNIFQYTLLYVGAFGATALTVVGLSIRYEMFWRGKPVKEKISKFKEVIDDTFRLGGLPVDKVMEYKLAICRDYAKLAASLLFKVYPGSKLYFIAIPAHIAVAVKTRDNYYILDQHLPILRVDKWLISRKKEKADVYVSEVLRDSTGELTKVTFSKHEPITRKPKPDIPKINTEKLTEEIATILGIKQSSQENEPDFDIPLPNYAIYYDDDGIIKYSLIKAIKNKLESELCSNLDKIYKIEIIQDGKDLILNVYLNDVRMNTEN